MCCTGLIMYIHISWNKSLIGNKLNNKENLLKEEKQTISYNNNTKKITTRLVEMYLVQRPIIPSFGN